MANLPCSPNFNQIASASGNPLNESPSGGGGIRGFSQLQKTKRANERHRLVSVTGGEPESVMAFLKTMSVVMLLALVSVADTAEAEEATRDARIERTISQSGNVMGVGFDSVWMMSLETKKLIRINPGDNSVTEILIAGVGGVFSGAGMAVGEAAI